MKKRTKEDYLRAIYELYNSIDDKERGIRSVDVAKALNVTKPTVSEMVRKLKDSGHVICGRYSNIFLTDKGLREARKIARSYEVIETFLAKVLRRSPRHIRKEAHELEHAFSEESIRRLDEFLSRFDSSIVKRYVR